MIRINKKGITFDYNNDHLTWLWWWNRFPGIKYESLIYEAGFLSLKQYWMYAGSVDRPLPVSKLKGYSVEEMINAWIKLYCRIGLYVVLYDINPEAKPATFWRTIPDKDKKQLLNDVVILSCKDWDQMVSLCDAIEPEFATATGIQDGRPVYWHGK